MSKVLFIIILSVFTIVCADALAQGGGPGCPPQDPDCADQAPINGISSLLIVGGVLFGGKKAYDLRKKNEEN